MDDGSNALDMLVVREWVGLVRDYAARGSVESAHYERDRLVIAVLKAIADGCHGAAELATAALRVEAVMQA